MYDNADPIPEPLRARLRSLERFEQFADDMPFGVVLLEVGAGPRGEATLAYANDQASAESRLDLRPLIGKSLREVAPNDHVGGAEHVAAPLMRCLLERGGHEMLEPDRGERGTFEIHYIGLGGQNVGAI